MEGVIVTPLGSGKWKGDNKQVTTAVKLELDVGR